MNPRLPYTTPGDDQTRRGRLGKAAEFLDAAETLREFGSDVGVFTSGSAFANAYVALCVLSGIAASDAICIRETGAYYKGADHSAAVPVLQAATDQATAKHLKTLLELKNQSQYDSRTVGDSDINRAGAAAAALLAVAQE